MRSILLAAVLSLLAPAMLASGSPYSSAERWPDYRPGGRYAPMAETARRTFLAQHTVITPLDYRAGGPFLSMGDWTWEPTAKVTFDSRGLPLVHYEAGAFPNPVTTAQYALTLYSRGDCARFLQVARALMDMQSPDGAFRFGFPFDQPMSGQRFAPGWTSALAQAHALNVYSRAYLLTGGPEYLQAGERALAYMLTPVDEGGVMGNLADLDPSLAGYITFEEYVADPLPHTLNGFMSSLLGLYDWSTLSAPGASRARAYFDRGVATLERILPYYDLGGITAYNLQHVVSRGQPVAFVDYHVLHISLLHALYSVTGSGALAYYERLWASYVPDAYPD